MFLRISSTLALSALTLAACGGEVSPPPPGEMVECAIGAGVDMAAVCTLERAEGDEIVIHHPDGGFRRFLRDSAGGTLAPLDGAESLVMTEGEGAALAFAVGEDRYRIPPELLAPPTP